MTAALTTTERATLLEPCKCGHSINNHGSLVACWTCDEDNRECATDFEGLLCERVAVIVEGRAGCPVHDTAEDCELFSCPNRPRGDA